MRPEVPGKAFPLVSGACPQLLRSLSLEVMPALWGLLEDRAGSHSVGRPLLLTPCVANWGDRPLYGVHLECDCFHVMLF